MIYGIYVPGLGDSNRPGESKLSGLWRRLHGINLNYHPVGWSQGRHFQPKLEDLLAEIDSLHAKHGKITLIGTSAGASAVLNAYARRPDKISSVVVICGKIQNPQGIGPAYRKSNPAFIESMDILAASLDSLTPKQLQNVLSRIPLLDEVVPLKDMRIPGANHKRQFTVLHSVSIVLGLTAFSYPAARFIKRLS